MDRYTFIKHPFPPIYDRESKVLILGSFPSIVSRENDFYFSNPHNRFWKVLIEGVFNEVDLKTKQSRKQFLLKHHIGMNDVIFSCWIISSSDASIKNPTYSDIENILKESKIKDVFLLGRTAYGLYKKKFSSLKVSFHYLPSTSPANARMSYEDLVKEYLAIKQKV